MSESSSATAISSSGMTPNELHDSLTSEPIVATSTSAPTADSQFYQEIAIALIDDPPRPMRETMDEEDLAKLAQSILEVGVIEPLVVERNGDRFTLICGHRRLIASGIAKLVCVPCIVRDRGVIDPLAVTVAENYYREDVNPAEEAAFLAELLEARCGGDIETLAAIIHHSVAYCDDRLALIRGDQTVLAELRARHINLAVARELNRVKDDGRRLVYLDAAIRGGATAAVVRRWRADGEILGDTQMPGPAAAGTDGQAQMIAPSSALQCFFCGDADEQSLIEVLYLHRPCKKFLQRILDAGKQPASEGKE
jgi:ParB/RepB/Spo0J family partition protein